MAIAPDIHPALAETGLVVAVVGGPVAGRTFPINKHEVVIGRDASCDIVLDDPSLSRQHASISANAMITDLGSTNGTWIDDVPVIAPTPVALGALVRVGATHCDCGSRTTTTDRSGCPSAGSSRSTVRPAPRPHQRWNRS